jgi:hypothetical protein
VARARVAPGSPELGRGEEGATANSMAGKRHESTGRERRTAVRRSRVGRRNSGEPFRPRGGDLRRAKAWTSFIRGRGDTGSYSGELDRAKSTAPTQARWTAAAKHRRRRNWPSTGRNKEN